MTDWKQQVTVQLETVTPLFLGGADPRGEPELRPPAFRGALRYWFRAALGGVIGDKNLEGLRKLEREVFGDAEYGSPIAIQARWKPLQFSEHPILPHKTPSGRRRAFNPGQGFEVVLHTTRPVKPLVWSNAIQAFNLAILLGGLGLRSRRGAGSLRVVKSSSPELVPPFPNDPGEISRFIEKVLSSAVDMAKKLAEAEGVKVEPGLPTPPTQFPCAAKNAEIYLIKDWASSAQDALANLMRRMPQQRWLGGISPRQGSPLWANILYTPQRYHLLLCVLPSTLASGAQDYQKVSTFLKTFEAKDPLVVKGWNA